MDNNHQKNKVMKKKKMECWECHLRREDKETKKARREEKKNCWKSFARKNRMIDSHLMLKS